MKKICYFLLTVLMLFAVSVSVSAATVAQGNCGSGVSWKLDDAGTMTISGRGAMKDYQTQEDRPWNQYINNINKVVVSNGVTSIGMGAFAYADNLTDVSLPDSVTTINMAAFGECRSLTSITLPDTLKTLKEIVFAYCPLESIVIPASVTEIGAAAFGGCDYLTYVSIEGAPAIRDNAFADCTSLGSLYFYGNAPSAFGVDVFLNICPDFCMYILESNYTNSRSGWQNFASSHSNLPGVILPYFSGDCGENVTWRLHGMSAALIIEGTGPMASFANEADRPWHIFIDDITSLVVEEGVTTIGPGAIFGADYVYNILLPDSLQYIGDAAFAQCSSLEQIHIPAGVGASHWSFLLENPSLREITVDPANTYYSAEDNVLYANNKTILHTYPAGKTDEMFIVPESVEMIYSHAFSAYDPRTGSVGNSYLKHVIIIGNIRELHSYAFAMNSSIENVVFFTNAPWIENGAFEYLYESWNHIKVYFPVGASGWENIVSTGCNGVKEWIPVYSGGLIGNTIMMLIRNDGLAEFIGSGSLWEEIAVPANLKEMILHFQINEQVDYIGYGLFNDCPRAETITFQGTVPPECHSNAFDNMPSLHTAYVPVGSLSTYVDAFRTQGIALPLAEEGQEHSHTFASGVWEANETYHWQACTVCSAIIRSSAHTVAGAAGTCSVCGYAPENISVLVSVTDMQITPGGDAAMTLSLAEVPGNGLNSLSIAVYWNPQYLTITETIPGELPFAITNSLNHEMGMGGIIFETNSPVTETGTLCTIFFKAADLDVSEFPATENMLIFNASANDADNAGVVCAVSDYSIEIVDPSVFAFTYEVNEGGTATITGFTGEPSADLIIPDEIDGYTVTAIGEMAFKDCTCFNGTLTIPAGVTELGDRAFWNCSSLESVYFEGGVPAEWGSEVFGNTSEDFVICYNYGIDDSWTTPTWTAPDGSVYKTVAYGAPVVSTDFNGDGTVTEDDALYLLRHTLLPERYPLASGDGDCNGDTHIDAEDAEFLIKKIRNVEVYAHR